jgi:tRNA 2-thiouridine synthesizing protein A
MKVDARGLSCPQPVLLAMQAMADAGSGIVEVLVDTEASRENVMRAAQSKGWQARATDLPEGGFRLELSR